MSVYTVSNLTKIYPGQPAPANDDISFAVEAGEIFGLLGDNGAGKSTLVKQMANLLRPTRGAILLLGQPVSDPLHVPLRVGYMPQTSRALNSLTVGEAVYFTAHLRGHSRRDAAAERERLLALWGLEALRNRPSNRVSGGQQRLLQLAVAMAGQPPVLLLDEPTNELAPQRRRHVWDTLRAENRQRGTTILFITHDAIEAEKIIQRVGILRDGRLVALGRPQALKQRMNQQLRLELNFSPDAPPRLPDGLQPLALDAGRWMLWLDRPQVEPVLAALNAAQIDDFRLHSATLEDLYLHYTESAAGGGRAEQRLTTDDGPPTTGGDACAGDVVHRSVPAPLPMPDAKVPAPAPRPPQPFLQQFLSLFQIELSNWRWGWRNLVLTGTVLPLFMAFLLGAFARDLGGQALAYVLTGNLVVALLFEHQGKLASHFAFMKMAGSLDYFATLPIHKPLLIVAASAAFFLLFLPALLATLFGGAWILGLSLDIHPLALLVIPLCALPLAGIGALMGVSFRTPEEAMAVDRLLVVLMMALGPVLIPPDRLPDWLVALGFLSPATYAASALRQVLLGPLLPSRLLLDASVLLLCIAVSFWLVHRRMDWRER